MSVLATADTPVLLACLALAVAVLVFLFWIQRDKADEAPHRTRLDQLLDRRDAVYENLRDLRFEFRAGKLSEQDYNETRQVLEGEAALVLAEIEMLTAGGVTPATRQAATQAARRSGGST